MVFKVVVLLIVVNLIYELVELIFPAKKINLTIKSFSLIVMLYAVCDYLVSLI